MFWDNVAFVYDIFVNVINRRTHRALREIVGQLVTEDDSVLECACGTGLLTEVLTPRCRHLTATDFSSKMLTRARKNCARFSNVDYAQADITSLPYGTGSFDAVVAANVIHLLDQPIAALRELDRVCRRGGLLIIPTYMNRTEKSEAGTFVSAVGKAGADFKRQFTPDSYRAFFLQNGYSDVTITLAEGRIPCAVAVMTAKGT